MDKFNVSVSPHIKSNVTTQRIMIDVLIGLAPVTVAAIVLFGVRALAIICVCLACSVLCEVVSQKIMKRTVTVSDCSAAVTGLLLALSLPANAPLWQAAIGCIFAIVVVKQLFGGLGQNFANPAVTARVMMLISFSNSLAVATNTVFFDSVTSATPLAMINDPNNGAVPDYLQLFLGNHAGTIGETCSLALLIGGIYLLMRKVITWHEPVVFIGTVMLLSIAFGRDPLTEVLTGGVLIAAFFMATDYVTTPAQIYGRMLFGFGCGLITVIIRVYGNYPEGVSFAILLMNILTPYIDNWTKKKVIGGAAK